MRRILGLPRMLAAEVLFWLAKIEETFWRRFGRHYKAVECGHDAPLMAIVVIGCQYFRARLDRQDREPGKLRLCPHCEARLEEDIRRFAA